jgi:hypothetical protein
MLDSSMYPGKRYLILCGRSGGAAPEKAARQAHCSKLATKSKRAMSRKSPVDIVSRMNFRLSLVVISKCSGALINLSEAARLEVSSKSIETGENCFILEVRA